MYMISPLFNKKYMIDPIFLESYVKGLTFLVFSHPGKCIYFFTQRFVKAACSLGIQ